jgi:hypothetical protein
LASWLTSHANFGIGLLMGSAFPDGTRLGALDIDRDEYVRVGRAVLRGPPSDRIWKKGAGCRLGEGETYVGGSPSPSRERLRAWSPGNTEAMFIVLARAAGESATMARKRNPFEFHLGKSERSLDEAPDFMKDDAGLGLENISADDIVWLTPGNDGELDVHLSEPLDLVLFGIIRANPKAEKHSERSDRQRLKQARAALLGKSRRDPGLANTSLLGKSRRDPGLTKSDDKILLKVARRVLERIVAGSGASIELAPLIREHALTDYTPESLERSEDGANSIVRRLIDHFDKCRDEYLTRVTTRDDFGRARDLRLVNEIFERLERLRVEVARDGMPRTSREDEL